MINSEILHEITPLSEKDCFYVIERNKTEFTFPLHKHLECELNYIEHAENARRTVGDSVEVITNFDLVLITGSELEHTWENYKCTSDEIREITIQFSPELFFKNFIDKHQFRSVKVMLEQAQKGLAFPLNAILHVRPLLNSLSHEKQGFYAVMNFLSLLYELSLCNDIRILSSSAFARVKLPADSRRVQKVHDYMIQNYTQEIRLGQLADIVGMSEVAFSRFFKLRTGKSVTDYLLDIRIGNAIRLLVDSTQSISEICYSCGFNNLSNFNRIFLKRKGCTPKEFRENYNKKKTIV
ncbi:MAG: helix-turn-helix transcriptional regulator [Bacteroidetes bacterium]|nr:helix-turn-helix transcriptional regulator [Bacteroidota bacterium]